MVTARSGVEESNFLMAKDALPHGVETSGHEAIQRHRQLPASENHPKK
jgi:hypothetical protein